MTISYKDQIIHFEPIECAGCNEKFSLTVRLSQFDSEDKYCANCFAHVSGLKDYEEVWNDLSPLNQKMWEIPSNKLSIETLKQMSFVDTRKNID